MIKMTTIFILLAMISIVSPFPALALEALSPDQMKQTVARAGVDIAIDSATVQTYLEHFKLNNTDSGLTDQYMSLDGIHIISTLNTGSDDMNDDGQINHLSLDVGLYSGKAMLYAVSPDLDLTTDIHVDNVDFYGTNVGSIDVVNLGLSSFHLYLGPHDSTGIDFELGLRLKADSVEYQYNPAGSLALSGIILAQEITGAPENPLLWETNGEFKIGDIAHNKPATIDFQLDTNPDPLSPRYNSGYIAMNLPMEGSFRIQNLTFGSQDFGSIAIDGLEVEKLYIEIPGRGLGK